MTWFNILLLAVLCLSFVGGAKDGAVKKLFSLLALVLAIPLAGAYYYLVASILAFLPGTDLENFLGFFITLALVILVLHLVFFLPRKIAEKVWEGGLFYRLIGGVASLLSAGVGMVVFTLALAAYPIIGWLEQILVNSSVIAWLVAHLGFVAAMLPRVFQNVANFTVSL